MVLSVALLSRTCNGFLSSGSHRIRPATLIKRSASTLPNEVTSTAVKGGAAVALQAAQAVSKAVAMKELAAPDLDRSLIVLDLNASAIGEVDASGLPLVYNKELIEKYWAKERGALQARWAEFLRYSVPFLAKVAGMLIQGGTDELVANGAGLARDARVIMEQLGPTCKLIIPEGLQLEV